MITLPLTVTQARRLLTLVNAGSAADPVLAEVYWSLESELQNHDSAVARRRAARQARAVARTLP